jgi:hypothetical protein
MARKQAGEMSQLQPMPRRKMWWKSGVTRFLVA